MKKTLILLLSLAIMLIFCACDGIINATNNQKENASQPEAHTHTFGDWVITKAATCTEEGEQTKSCSCGEKNTEYIPKLENHIGIGSCSSCGLNYYDALVEYIKSNGQKATSGNSYSIEYPKLASWDTAIVVRYDDIAGDQYIAIGGKYEDGYDWKYAYIFIYKYKIKYGEYDWRIFGQDWGDFIDYDGVLDVSKISPNAPIELVDRNTSDDLGYESLKIREIINEILPQFLEDSKTNISMANLGFERFED